MRGLKLIVAGLALAVAPAAVSAAPADVAAAVAAEGRGADNVKLDESRKPAEVLQFLGLEQGMRAIDLFGGNLYWAEIMAPAVGPGGHVTVWEPVQFTDDKARQAFADFAAKQGNVTLLISPMQTPMIGTDAYDFAMLNLNYHDVYWESEKYGIPRMEPGAWVARLHSAMKPGGIVAVIDHSASAGGDTREVVEKLHRIDPAVVVADFQRAGFVLDGSSELLRNPADDKSVNVFDPAIRGKTDRFVLRFKKPS